MSSCGVRKGRMVVGWRSGELMGRMLGVVVNVCVLAMVVMLVVVIVLVVIVMVVVVVVAAERWVGMGWGAWWSAEHGLGKCRGVYRDELTLWNKVSRC